MNEEDFKEFNERSRKLRELERSSFKKVTLITFGAIFLLFLCNVLIIALNQFYVQSSAFCFLSSSVTAFFIFRQIGRETRQESDRVSKETKKIFDQKE